MSREYTLEELVTEVREGRMSADEAVAKIPDIVAKKEYALLSCGLNVSEVTNLFCNYVKGVMGETPISEVPDTALKDLIADGKIKTADALRYVTEVVGYVSRICFIDQYKEAFDSFLERHKDWKYMPKFLLIYKGHLQQLLGELSSVLGNVVDGSSFASAISRTFLGEDDKQQMEGFIDVLSLVYSKIPFVGTVAGIICETGKNCLAGACELREAAKKKQATAQLQLAFGDVLLDDQVYINFNTFLKGYCRENVGAEHVSKLYISQEILEKRLGPDMDIDKLLPTDVFFLMSVTKDSAYGSFFMEFMLEYLGKDENWIIEKMEEYCQETLFFYDAVYSAMKEVKSDWNRIQEGMDGLFGGGSGSGGSGYGGQDTDDEDSDDSDGDDGEPGGDGDEGGAGGSGSTGGGGSTGGSGSTGGGGSTGGSGNNGGTSGSKDDNGSGPRDDGDSSSFWEDYINRLQDAKKKFVRVDPLVLDLNNDNVFASSVEDGVHFDYEGDGFKEKTAWMTEGDGMLVRDVNENGSIDDGTELFGDRTVMSNGEVAVDGFEALTDLDSNMDGVVNSQDEVFDKLMIWTDSNNDGISQQDELHTLEEMGIEEISLSGNGQKSTDTHDNIISGMTQAVREDGTVINVGELFFVMNTSQTLKRDDIVLDEDVLDMPEINGRGKVYSLRQAMSMNDELKGLITTFIALDDRTAKKNMMDDILIQWTGSAGLNLPSRGSHIDAVRLRVLEQFYGAEYVGVNGANPNANAAPILNKLYEDLKYHIYANLIFKTDCVKYMGKEGVMYDGTGDGKVSLALLQYLAQHDVFGDGELLKENVEIIAYCINDTGIYSGDMILSDLFSVFEINTELFDAVCRGITRSSFQTTAEQLIVNGDIDDNYIKGTQESNTLYGGSGNDIFVTSGTSTIQGGAGDDVYVIGYHSGKIEIRDSVGNNRLCFEEGITVEDVAVSVTENNGIVLHIAGSDTEVVFPYFRSLQSNRKFYLEFSDGTVFGPDDVDSPFRHIVGTEEDDTIDAGFDKSMKVQAGAGNDNIRGSAGKDEIYGEEGKDNLTGGDGDDILVGGTGEDRMQGSAGNDTY
ncbi:MAG: calcium-binding protein, partial [Lachnospiraceae bacterium]|nr:calcium-binding protein [Lachnospiraceae bacterium]